MSETTRVYKFYSANRGLENLSKSQLKISTLDDLNDPFEFRGLSFPTKHSRKIWENTRENLLKNKGLICFCQAWDNPVIWSHYAENHRGIALGFDVPTNLLLHVNYLSKRRKVPDLTLTPRSELCDLVRSALASKYKHWEYEDEVRTFVQAEQACPDNGLFFKYFDDDLILREVVIGAESQVTSDQVRQVAKNGKLDVLTARLAFKSYKVVKQRSTALQR